MEDLRTFIDSVKRQRPRELVRVARTVSPQFETAAILSKLEQRYRFPVLWFEHVQGSPFPLVTNVCGAPSRLALALNCSVAELSHVYASRCAQPVAPVLAKDGEVHSTVQVGGDVDLLSFPQLVYHEGDSERGYITAAIVVAVDPGTNRSNLSYHRLMVIDRASTAIFMAAGKDLDRIFRKYRKAATPMPIAAIIGVHPVCALGAVYTGSAGQDEYHVSGGLQQAPLDLVRCVTSFLQVPANAEFVLEGVVTDDQVTEGPFGEFTGYSTGVTPCPVFRVHAITSREKPVFQDIVSGHAEHLLLSALGLEHHLLQMARSVVPSTLELRMAVPMAVVVAIDKMDDSEPRRLIEALLSRDIYTKQIIVVDRDVNLSDPRQVATAVALHVRADKDIYIFPAQQGTQLDPSSVSDDGVVAKFGIDATVPLARTRPLSKNRIPQRVLDSIDQRELMKLLNGCE